MVTSASDEQYLQVISITVLQRNVAVLIVVALAIESLSVPS